MQFAICVRVSCGRCEETIWVHSIKPVFEQRTLQLNV